MVYRNMERSEENTFEQPQTLRDRLVGYGQRVMQFLDAHNEGRQDLNPGIGELQGRLPRDENPLTREQPPLPDIVIPFRK